MENPNPGAAEREAMWKLAERLFPIFRSICGPGVKRVLEAIGGEIPLRIREYPTGLECGSWTVPREWEPLEAYLETLDGRRILDWRDNGLHLWLFSRPFEGVVKRDELLKHVHTRPELPDAVPVRVTFYQENWGFCMSERMKQSLREEEYRVVIRTRLFDGAFRIGEAVLPGDLSEEIVLDSYICHPLLANDNQSGVAVAVELFKMLARLPRRRYTYRLVLCPETVGPAVYLHQDPELRKRIAGGYTFVSVGDGGSFHYRSSYHGDSVADRAIAHALKHCGIAGTVEPYDVRSGTTGNEKGYNAPGFFIPVGSLRRSHIGAYPEHCTSFDNLDFIRPDALLETLRLAWMAVQALERTVVYRPLFTGEPFLTRYGLFPHGKSKEERFAWDYLKGFTDGRNSLIDIADKGGLFVADLDAAVSGFLEKGLIEEVRGPAVARGGR